MSATICLYRVVPNVTYTGTIFDKAPTRRWINQKNGHVKIEEYEKANGAPDWETSFKEYNDWLNLQYDNCWSDGKSHGRFDRYVFYMRKETKKNRPYKRILKRLNGFNWNYYPTADGEMMICLPVEEVLYYQGWFFKKKFFKKKCTAHYCTTKDQIIHFFDQYVISTKDYSADVIRDMRQNILDTWEDGMILEILW